MVDRSAKVETVQRAAKINDLVPSGIKYTLAEQRDPNKKKAKCKFPDKTKQDCKCAMVTQLDATHTVANDRYV